MYDLKEGAPKKVDRSRSPLRGRPADVAPALRWSPNSFVRILSAPQIF